MRVVVRLGGVVLDLEVEQHVVCRAEHLVDGWDLRQGGPYLAERVLGEHAEASWPVSTAEAGLDTAVGRIVSAFREELRPFEPGATVNWTEPSTAAGDPMQVTVETMVWRP